MGEEQKIEVRADVMVSFCVLLFLLFLPATFQVSVAAIPRNFGDWLALRALAGNESLGEIDSLRM